MQPVNAIALPKPADRGRWLIERRKGIGGSDAAASVGLSKWMTPLQLFYDKLGQLQRDETESMRWGTLMEPVVRQEYANRTGHSVTVPDVIYQHRQHKFAIVNLDGIVDIGRVYEGKTSRTGEGWGEPGTDEVPGEYNLQVQHGMAITGLPAADIAVLIGGSDFRIYCVEADLELQAMLLEAEAAFWQMVEQQTPPDTETPTDVRLRWRLATGKKVVADEAATAATIELKQLKMAMKAAEEREEELKAQLQSFMKDAAELHTESGAALATWKNVNLQPKFDVKTFRAEQPELFAKYLRDPEPQRQFLLKVKG